MFPTLFAKTFVILSSQLAFTWVATVSFIQWLRGRHRAKVDWISASKNESGELDLELSWQVVRRFFWALLIADFVLFIVLFFWGKYHLAAGMTLFSAWSVVTGIELALVLVSIDENVGVRVLALAVSITVFTAFVGSSIEADLSFLSDFLLFALLALLGANSARLVFRLGGRLRRKAVAVSGVAVFIGYLVFDFNALARMQDDPKTNTWPVAMDAAINLYLDIINLILELLDAMGDS